MAGKLSTYLANELLDHTLNNASYTQPTTVYLALYTSNPTADDSGTEVSGGSYSRQSISFGAAASAAISNNATLTFSSLPTAVVTHWGIRDASSGGNLLFYGAFDSEYNINSGDQMAFNTGNIDVIADTTI